MILFPDADTRNADWLKARCKMRVRVLYRVWNEFTRIERERIVVPQEPEYAAVVSLGEIDDHGGVTLGSHDPASKLWDHDPSLVELVVYHREQAKVKS